MLRDDLSKFPDYRPGKSAPGALKFSANEMTQPPLPAAIEAMAEACAQGNRYPVAGCPDLTDELASELGLPTDHIAITPGASAVVQQAVMMTCTKGDEVLFPWRSFEAYPLYARVAGAEPVTVPLTEDHRLDLPAVLAAITDRTRIIILCNPNNPTGTTITRAEFRDFMAQVPSDIVVVLDEAYYEFNRVTDTPNAAEEVQQYPNLIGARTFSKAYALAGLRVGYGFGNPELMNGLNLLALPLTVTSIAEQSAIASLRAKDQLDARINETIEQRERVAQALGGVASQTNFVFLPTDEGADMEAKMAEQNVIIRYFPGSGIRVSITDTVETDQFLEAWRAAGLPLTESGSPAATQTAIQGMNRKEFA